MGKYKLINKFTLISSLFIILILTTGMSNQNNSFSGKIFKNIYIEQSILVIKKSLNHMIIL